MIPTTYEITLALTILTMLCWGSWANTTKMAKGYRFELFYFDYSIAVFLVATAAALTLGMMDAGTTDSKSLNLNFVDNLETTFKSNIGFAMIGGAVFNLANMLLVAAIGVAGMAVAFPIGIGLALIGGAVLSYFVHPAGSAPLLFCGVGLVFMAMIVSALAHAAHNRVDPAQLRTAQSRPLQRGEVAPRKASPMKGIMLSLASGILMAAWYPLVELGKRGELFDVGLDLGRPFFVGLGLFFRIRLRPGEIQLLQPPFQKFPRRQPLLLRAALRLRRVGAQKYVAVELSEAERFHDGLQFWFHNRKPALKRHRWRTRLI